MHSLSSSCFATKCAFKTFKAIRFTLLSSSQGKVSPVIIFRPLVGLDVLLLENSVLNLMALVHEHIELYRYCVGCFHLKAT